MFNNLLYDDIPWLSLEGVECECKVIDVYDADTITVAIPFHNKVYKVKCRLLGIDSAEKRTKNLAEKTVSLEATKWLSDLIKDKIIWIKCGDWGKYGGRILGTIYMNKESLEKDESINKLVVEKGYAYEYTGNKKKKFEEWHNKN